VLAEVNGITESISEKEQTTSSSNPSRVDWYDLEMLALDWNGHSKISHNTRLKFNRFLLNHKLSERRSFLK